MESKTQLPIEARLSAVESSLTPHEIEFLKARAEKLVGNSPEDEQRKEEWGIRKANASDAEVLDAFDKVTGVLGRLANSGGITEAGRYVLLEDRALIAGMLLSRGKINLPIKE